MAENEWINELNERSKDDRAIIVGSEVRALVQEIRRLTREREEARAGLKHQASDYTIRCEQLAEARAALAASERREAALREVLDELATARADLAAARESHARLARSVKAALGLKNWPTIEGNFADGVGKLVADALARAGGAKLTTIENPIDRTRCGNCQMCWREANPRVTMPEYVKHWIGNCHG